MASPFPGMDPYLEAQGLWPDFHSRFINAWGELLGRRLPDEYDARIDERVYLVDLTDNETQLIAADIAIERDYSRSALAPSAGGVAVLEPVTIPHLLERPEVRESYIKILHRPDRQLVAVLELLSPSNKESSGRDQYRSRQLTVLSQPVHLVELDLLIGGHRLRMRRPLPPGDYYALVSRIEQRPNSDVYHWTLRQPLPTIPIPLKSPDPDIPIDLGSVFALTYERGRYERVVDYSIPPALSLNQENLEWAANLARSAKR